MKTLTLTALFSFALVVNPAGQKALQKKSYEQWTLREVMGILSDSPWAQTAVDRKIDYERPGSSYMVEVRLYSALPIRQAIVRRMRLTIPYNELTVSQRTSYDAEVEGLLKCPLCSTYYIVTLTSAQPDPLQPLSGGYHGPAGTYVFDVVALLKRVPDDELLQRVSLSNDNGERRTAVKLTFTKRNEVVFLFPRFDDQGKPLITASNKKFYFEVDQHLFRKEAHPLKKFTYEISRLLQDGDVIF